MMTLPYKETLGHSMLHLCTLSGAAGQLILHVCEFSDALLQEVQGLCTEDKTLFYLNGFPDRPSCQWEII